jgi:hypothetical protein
MRLLRALQLIVININYYNDIPQRNLKAVTYYKLRLRLIDYCLPIVIHVFHLSMSNFSLES